MAEVIEINDLEQLEQYRLAWNALLPQTPRVSFFHSFDWLKTYWEHFGRERQLRVMVVRSEGRTIGIVPLCVQTERYQVGPVRVLTYPLSDWGTWYGPIGPNPTASLFMAMKHLRDTPRDWDMIDLRWSDVAGSGSDFERSAMAAAGWRSVSSAHNQTSIIKLAGTDWEGYRRVLSKKWRHELGRQQRGLLRDFEVSFERHRPLGTIDGDCDPAWDLYENCLEIAEHSWQGRSTDGTTLSHSQVRPFLLSAHQVAAKLGMVDMVVLKLNGQAAAFQYNYHYDGKLYGLRMGYDKKYAGYGVGRALLGWMIEDSFARGDSVIDLGVGDYKFKQKFRTGIETNWRHSYYPWQALRGQGVRLSRWVKSRWNLKEIAAKQ